jgi:uncharacterized protein
MASQFQDRLKADINEARRGLQKERTLVLTTLLSELKNEEIKLGHELKDDECLGVVSRAIKQRRDAVTQFRAGNREDLVTHEEGQIAILQVYLPPQLGEAEVRAMVGEIVAAGAGSVGAVMGQLVPRIKGRFDGKEANRIVREVLGG